MEGNVGRRRVLGLAALVGLAACAGASRPEAPAPIPAPELDGAAPFIALELEWAALPEPGSVVYDEILRSPLMRDPDFQREVERWVVFWRTTGGRWFPEYLERMQLFSPTVDSALSRRRLPPSLRYLPIIESGYSPKAVSRASAVGLWQFMAPTAQGYGMWVGPLLDERRNPFKSTEAAGDFLLALREQFGSWFLALAAYNSGPYRVQRVLDRHAPLTPRSDSLYWAIRGYLPRETRDFVPKFIAAAAVARNPTTHGFAVPSDTLGFEFDEVVVSDATTLDVVAEAAQVPQAEIERLNPEVVRGITPPGRRTTLRVPAGRGGAFQENYARIPPSERVTFVEHRVVRGETLSHIARRYDVPLGELQAANPRVSPRRLQIGQRITVPIAPRPRAGS
jgi:membrane-bound lytic murein transglycosylase D